MLNRIIATAVVVGAVGLAAVVACGGNATGPAKMDAPKQAKMDAPGGEDAPGSGSGSGPTGPNLLGSACITSCPDSFTCLVNSNDPGFCSQPCEKTNDTCNDGYAGP